MRAEIVIKIEVGQWLLDTLFEVLRKVKERDMVELWFPTH